MTRVIESTFTEDAPEQDGRRWVNERHLCDDGETLTYGWLGTQDAALVIAARAAELNRQYEARDAAEALIVGTKIPLDHYAFRQLFPSDKRPLIDRFNATFESRPGLTDEQRDAVRSGLEDFRLSKHVKRPFEPQVQQMLGLYRALGLLTAEEAAEILGHG